MRPSNERKGSEGATVGQAPGEPPSTYPTAHREEVTGLAMTLLTEVTEFFRDQEAFEYLRAHVLPELIEKGRRHGRVLRVWSAGCATGEEPYSLALLLADILGAELPEWNIKIFATDLDEGAIAFARRGLYPHNVLKKVPTDLRVRFFDTVDDGLQITRPLRQLVIFGIQDISRGVPLPRIDLVLCRNLLTYFKPELQQVVLDLFAYSLQHPKGYLFLSKAETARPSSANYEQVDMRWKVYRCINGPLPGTSRHSASSPRDEVNKELQDANEELQAINEELTLTQQELQATNEEFLRVSPRDFALLRHLKGGADELVGQRRGDASPLTGQEDSERLYRAVVEARAPQRMSELRLKVDGRETVWDMTLVPLVTREEGAGLVQFVVVSAVEVTEAVRAREEARRVDRLKGEFLSLVSHELRTPLAAVGAYASLLQAMVKEGGDDPRAVLAKAGEYVQKCGRMIEHLNRLVDDLFDVARLESGKFTLQRAPLEMVEFVARFVEAMRPLITRPPLRCELPEGGGGLFVLGDEGRLQQVLTNLVSNAAQYASEGESIEVSVRRVPDANAVEVSVRDHGPGIPAEQHEAVFQPFHQVGQAPRSERDGLGLGLGLYMCRQIVQQHDGTITLESAPSEGSTFRIRIPMIEG